MEFQKARKLRTTSYVIGGIITLWLVFAMCWSLIGNLVHHSGIELPPSEQEQTHPTGGD